MNIEWAIEQLEGFAASSGTREVAHNVGEVDPYLRTVIDDALNGQAPVVESILGRVFPGWSDRVRAMNHPTLRWQGLRDVCIQAAVVLRRRDEMRENLGEVAPELSAAELHPWIWSGAKSLWQSGHFREAVEGAIKKLNAETQNKVGRRDVSETDRFKQVFSTDEPKPDKARLRRMQDDGSNTYKSVQRGAMAFAEGVFAGIRNPLTHEANQELSEQEALKYLAALSVLARWVDAAQVKVAS